jgi:tRNA(Ser,Leu) C12 N-acetylase TAN1
VGRFDLTGRATFMGIERLEQTTFLVTCAGGWEQRAREEVRRAVPGATARALFMRGNLLVTCEEDYATALQAFDQAQSECLGRVIPLHVRCDIGKGREHLETLAEASDPLPGPSPEATFKAVCERRGAHEWTSRDAEIGVGSRVGERTGAPVDFDNPEQWVRIEVFQDIAFLGYCWADELLHKEITRMRKWAPGTRPINRAELKLREILDRFELTLPAEGRALDIGAAPGGWTQVLSEHMAEVVAVDPGALDERVLALPKVTHLPVRSEALLENPDLGAFAVVTNDMNMDPDKSAQILCDLAPLVAPGGLAIMTVKFVTRHRHELIQAAIDVLESCYEILRVGRVPHNAKETTLLARRRP